MNFAGYFDSSHKRCWYQGTLNTLWQCCGISHIISVCTGQIRCTRYRCTHQREKYGEQEPVGGTMFSGRLHFVFRPVARQQNTNQKQQQKKTANNEHATQGVRLSVDALHCVFQLLHGHLSVKTVAYRTLHV